MTALEWGDTETKRYDYGIDRGVIHSLSLNLILPWNGLRAVNESEEFSPSSQAFFEGNRYANALIGGFYRASVSGYTFPHEFIGILGQKEAIPGLILTGQPSESFNFSYRHMTGEESYRLHLVWNCMATPTKIGYTSLSDDPTPTEFEWEVSAVPPESLYWRPTAQFVVDSGETEPAVLEALETYLYGSDSTDPAFPSQLDMFLMFL